MLLETLLPLGKVDPGLRAPEVALRPMLDRSRTIPSSSWRSRPMRQPG
jgi:hypothetical protein